MGKGLGIAGFVLALLGVILAFVPVLGFILAALGITFSIIQLTKEKTGLAIAGLILGIIGILLGIAEIVMMIWVWSFLRTSISTNGQLVENMTRFVGNMS
jgi:hypothetical protein